MADFPGSVWAGYGGLGDLVDFFTAARANDISDEVVALEDYFITTTRADSTALLGPASGGPSVPTWRVFVGADIPIATDALRGTVEFATGAETITGASSVLCVTPGGLLSALPAVPAAGVGVQLDGSGNLIMPDDGRTEHVGTAGNLFNNLTMYSATNGHQWTQAFRKSHQNTAGHTVTVTGENLGNITWDGNDGSAFTEAAYIEAVQNGAAGVNTPADLVFYASDGTGAPGEALRITKDGHLVMAAGNDINLANGQSVGIDSSNERIEFYTAGHIAMQGATIVIGSATPSTNMTRGVTIDMLANDDEAINVRSSDVGAVLSGLDTGTYFAVYKSEAAAGGAVLEGLKDADGGNYAALQLTGALAENADTDKTTAARAITEIWAFQTDGASSDNTVADGNVLTLITKRAGAFVAVAIWDEDGDFYYDGALNNYDHLADEEMARDLQLVLTGRQGARYNLDAMVDAGILHPSEHGVMVSHKKITALQLGAHAQAYDDRRALERRIKQLEAWMDGLNIIDQEGNIVSWRD